MGLRYNPFNGSFDFTRSPGSYLDGEVATFADLPLDTAAAPLNSAWLVREGSGLWLLTRKPAGIYIRTATGGTDRNADYTYASAFPDVFSDANLVVYNDADSTKNVKLSAASLTTGTTRTLTVPDKSGTLATTDAGDMASGTLADARLSSNVPLKDAANTFSANQTLNGTNNVAPNQTAASGSSIMTRDLGDTRYRQTQVASVSSVALTQNNTTLEDISGLSVSLDSGTYAVTLCVWFNANASAGSKMALTFSGTSSQTGIRQTSSNVLLQSVSHGSFSSTSFATADFVTHWRTYTIFVTAAGVLQVQGAQNVAGVNAISATGFIKAERL